MAARYGASSFSRGARSAFNSFRNSSSASQTARPPPRMKNPFENGSPSINRRRLAQTMVPLHAAVSSALLVTRLSISSRSSHSISRELESRYANEEKRYICAFHQVLRHPCRVAGLACTDIP